MKRRAHIHALALASVALACAGSALAQAAAPAAPAAAKPAAQAPDDPWTSVLDLAAYYNFARADSAANGRLRAQVQLMFST